MQSVSSASSASCRLSHGVGRSLGPDHRHLVGAGAGVSNPDLEPDQMLIAQVVISRVMQGDDIIDHVIAATMDGDELRGWLRRWA